jgi:UDPglucose--hexose-1-phosphate uridylyltransferase
MKIDFEKHVSQAVFHSPLKNFELDSQQIETRIDPLTGLTTKVRTGRKAWQRLYTTDEKLLAEIAEKTREGCFFCPEKVKETTPRYPEELIPGGRIVVGEACLFPNLFAQKEYSAITVISRQHFVQLDQFTTELFANAFKACSIYFNRLNQSEPNKYAEIGFNYLFPAGSSIVHPHLQVLASDWPYFLIANLLEHSQKYYTQHSACFWKDLVDTEKKLGQRYINRLGNTEWLVPFAPIREDEVHGIVRNKSNFLQFDDSDWENLTEGITRVFRYYKDKGLSSCNFALYSGQLGKKADYLWAGVRIVSRSSVQAQPINDVFYSQNLLYDGLITEPPEEIASALRNYF